MAHRQPYSYLIAMILELCLPEHHLGQESGGEKMALLSLRSHLPSKTILIT